jgi:hypothetical protein
LNRLVPIQNKNLSNREISNQDIQKQSIDSDTFHGFEDPVVQSFDLFIGITDHKFLLEVFEEVLFGLITSKNQVGVIVRLFKEALKGG